VLSPNDVRREEGWPRSNDPTADLIAPPNTSANAGALRGIIPTDCPGSETAPKLIR
jgi:hypothetical protein